MGAKPTLIRRTFALDAGHRLSKHEFKCQNFHGHRYTYEVVVEGVPDDELGYVIDFSNIKSPLMEAFDHTFLLNRHDPLLELQTSDGDWLLDAIHAEQSLNFYLMDDEPTVENIAVESVRLMWESMSDTERENVTAIEVDLSETPNCHATVRAESSLGNTNLNFVSP